MKLNRVLKVSMRREKRKKIARISLKSSNKIELHHQKIPKERFAALSDDEKYCFLLLGHIHDEISWLQRMAYAASRYEPRGVDVESSAQMMQATFLARLFLGKLFEAKVVLNKGTLLREFIVAYFNPDDHQAGNAKFQEITDAFEKNSWIQTARNKHFLHYPSRSDANEILTNKDIEWEVDVYHGIRSSNTFYPTSDVMANLAWLRLVEPNDPIKGLDMALEILQNIARSTLESLEISIGHFINEKLMDLSDSRPIFLDVPETIENFRLHYFLKI